MGKKYNALFYKSNDNYKTLVAISKDKWLLELFVGQRKIDKNRISIRKITNKEAMGKSDKFLIYYYGYSITDLEYQYIISEEREYESDLAFKIYEMENTLATHGRMMKPATRKALRKVIKKLKKINVEKDMKFISTRIDTIINRPGMVLDYFYAMDAFRNAMEDV